MKTHRWIFTLALTAICFASFGFVAQTGQAPFDTITYHQLRGFVATGGIYGTGTNVSREKIRLMVVKKDGIGTVVIMDTLRIPADDPITPTLGLLTSIDAGLFKATCNSFCIVTLANKGLQWTVDLKRCTAVDLVYDTVTKKVNVMVNLSSSGITRPSF